MLCRMKCVIARCFSVLRVLIILALLAAIGGPVLLLAGLICLYFLHRRDRILSCCKSSNSIPRETSRSRYSLPYIQTPSVKADIDELILKTADNIIYHREVIGDHDFIIQHNGIMSAIAAFVGAIREAHGIRYKEGSWAETYTEQLIEKNHGYAYDVHNYLSEAIIRDKSLSNYEGILFGFINDPEPAFKKEFDFRNKDSRKNLSLLFDKLIATTKALCIFLCCAVPSYPAHASIVDYSPRTGATALYGLIYEFESRAIGCTKKAGEYIVVGLAPKHGEVKTIVAQPLHKAGSTTGVRKEPIRFSVDYSDLSMVEISYVSTLLTVGQRLAIEFYECPNTQSKDVISARKIK